MAREKARGRPCRDRTLEELDRMLLAFRIGRAARRAGRQTGPRTETRTGIRAGTQAVGSWLRAIRQATGIEVEEVRQKLGVTRWEIFRLEHSEAKGRIQIETLRNAARGLNCELVYALVPLEGSLKEMAEEAGKARETRLRKARAERTEKLKPWIKETGAHELLVDGIRKALQRSYGVRVRPVRRPPDKQEVGEVFEKARAAVRLAQGVEMAMRTEGDGRGKTGNG